MLLLGFFCSQIAVEPLVNKVSLSEKVYCSLQGSRHSKKLRKLLEGLDTGQPGVAYRKRDLLVGAGSGLAQNRCRGKDGLASTKLGCLLHVIGKGSHP